MSQKAEAVQTTIDALAAKLSVPAEHLWGVLTAQAKIDAIQSFAWLPITGLLAWAWWRGFRWAQTNDKDGDADMPLFLSGLVVLGACVLTVGSAIAGVGYLFNPEYFAVKEVLRALK